MGKHYMLDLTGAKKPPWWKDGDPLVIDLVPGKYGYDFDVNMATLPEQVKERAYECLLSKKDIGWQRDACDIVFDYPFGVNEESIREYGAKLIAV